MKKCPFCAKKLPIEAVVCGHCGRDQWTAHVPLATAGGFQLKPKASLLRSRKAAFLLLVLVGLLALGLCGYRLG